MYPFDAVAQEEIKRREKEMDLKIKQDLFLAAMINYNQKIRQMFFSEYPFQKSTNPNDMNNPNEICRINIVENTEAINLCVGLRVGTVLRLYHRKNIPENPDAVAIKYFDNVIGYVKATDENQTRLHLHSREGHKLVAYVTKLNKTNPTLPMLEIGIKHYFKDTPASSPVEVPL